MKSKSIVLLAVSLGFGLIAAFGISQVLGRGGAPVGPPPQKMVEVYVAKVALNTKDVLSEETVELKEFPETLVPEEALTSLEDTENMVVRMDLVRGGIVTLGHLIDKSEINEIAIPDGYTVISIPVDDTVDGLLAPGDYVDLTGIFQPRDGKTAPFVRTFMKKVKVYSVQSRTEIGIDDRQNNANRISVLVTKAQSRKIFLAQRIATIKLSLISDDSSDEQADSSSTKTEDLFNENGGVDNVERQLAAKDRIIRRSPGVPALFKPKDEFVTVIHTNAGPMEYIYKDGEKLPILKSSTQENTPSPFTPMQGLKNSGNPENSVEPGSKGSASPAVADGEDEFAD